MSDTKEPEMTHVDEFTFTLVDKASMPRKPLGKYGELGLQLERNPDKVAAIPVADKREADHVRTSLGNGILRVLEHPEHYRVKTRVTDTTLYVWLEKESPEEGDHKTLTVAPASAPYAHDAVPSGATSSAHKLDWRKYPLRKAAGELGPCALCRRTIQSGADYHEGGYAGRRAHENCVVYGRE